MKKLLPILLTVLLTLSSCVKDNLDACAGLLHIYFSYIYGGTEQFFDVVETDVHLDFYYKDSNAKYRELSIERASIDINTPFLWEKTLEDRDSVTLISWTHDDRLEYVEDTNTPLGGGYVQLKEITEGSGICSPVDDLFYGTVSFDAGHRQTRSDVVIPYQRAVCRVRITMIPETVQNGDGSTRTDTRTPIPNAEDYTFHLEGTRNKIDYNNVTGGEVITLNPAAYYDETSGYVRTNWFGAFSSLGEYLNVKVFIKNEQVAQFDCAPIELSSTPGDYVDLVIDGRYMRPLMEVRINGWRLAIVESMM